jgi:hypothetical protein
MVSSAKSLRMGELILSRLVGAVSGAFLALVLLGCMNFAIGNREIASHDGLLAQEGEIHLGPKEEQDVYYPIPYANIPNLELTDDFSTCCKIIDQKEDHFRIHNTCLSDIEPHWHTRGVRAGLLPTPPQPLVRSSPPDLPSQPVPVQ